ncbi:hypothetical protein [Albirhodobacter sp. R86504]|jgi:transcriptional regulator with XRE-family HTH domain|uniref:hypothetical protein n=1 Tax=Albirhodobacter sp. R86504 TaxID=3093848 RepID=UPI00366D8B46
MRTTLTLAAILLAGAANAASVNAGQAQLAAQLGVSPTEYTLSELTKLKTDREEDGYALNRNAPGLVDTSVSGGYNAGKEQLAAQLGVNSADYTLAQLTQIKSERQEDGFGLIDQNYKADFGSSDTGSNNAGKAQLAAQLRVNPNDYTLTELTAIAADRRGSDS